MELNQATLMAFLRWWLKQLSELLPRGLLPGAKQRPDAFVIDVEHDGVALWLRRDGAPSKLAHAAADDAGMRDLADAMAAVEEGPHLLLYRVPRSMQLSKLSSFPLAARRDLANVLGFEMDRETPFGRGEVYWDYVVLRQDSAAGRLDVELLIVPRPFIDPVIEASRRAGMHPGAIEIDTGDGGFRLLRVGASRRWKWLQSQRPLVRVAAVAAGLFVLVILSPFIRQQIDLVRADSAIDALSEQAKEASGLRLSVDQAVQAIALVKKERDRNGSILEVLAATTKLVPDDSHLTALSFRAGRLTITGQSPASAHIVDLLAGSPAFKEPAFDSPVVQDEASGLETFTISASLFAEGLARQIAAQPATAAPAAAPDNQSQPAAAPAPVPRPSPPAAARLRPNPPPAAPAGQVGDVAPAPEKDDR